VGLNVFFWVNFLTQAKENNWNFLEFFSFYFKFEKICLKMKKKITKLLKPQNGKKKTPVSLIPVKPTAKGFIRCKDMHRFVP